MIIPSLFVGLGTTGTDILIEIRRLIFEEFGVPGLPMIKMVALETNNNKGTTDRNINIDYSVPYHKIDMIHIGIPSTTHIKQMLDPHSPTFHPGLNEWLDPEVLRNMSYSSGAGQIRMAGRLCLWQSWNSVQEQLTRALTSLRAKENREETIKILESYCIKKNIRMPSDPIGNVPKVTILGTFCGGTCSGIFIDIAYLLREIMRSQGLMPSVSGIFTIPDKTTSSQPMYFKDAVNCFTSLFELDYYHNHPNRKILSQKKKPLFKITPILNGNPIQDSEPPLDAVRVVSPSGRDTMLVGPDGKINPEPLNFMIALNLFMDTGTQTFQAKDGVRANVDNSPDFLKVPENGAGHAQFMSAFGLAALWYPKYKIVHAVSLQLAKELIDTWRKESSNQDLESAEQASIGFKIDDLFSSINLEAAFKQAIKENFKLLIETDDSLLDTEIQNIKASNGMTFLAQLKPGGHVFNQYQSVLQSNANSAKILLDNFYISMLNQLSNNFSCIEAIGRSLKNLDEILSRKINEFPQSAPVVTDMTNHPDLQRVLRQMRNIKTDKWMYLLFVREDAVKQKKAEYIEKYRKILNENFQQIRNYYTRQIYEDLRCYLGVQPGLGMAKLFFFQETIQQQFSRLEVRLREASSHLDNEYEKILQIQNFPSISLACDFREDIENTLAEEKQRWLGNSLVRTLPKITSSADVKDLVDIILKPGKEVADKLLAFFQSQVNLNMKPRIDPLKQPNLNEANLKQLFLESSQPMMQIEITPNPPAVRNPDIITGPDLGTVQNALTSLGITDLKKLASDYDNFVVVYRETGPFSLDQMSIYQPWNELYSNFDIGCPKHTRSQGFPRPTPPDQTFYNWLKVALLFNDELAIFNIASDGQLYRDYIDENGLKRKFVTDPDSPFYGDFIHKKQNRIDLIYTIKGACQQIGKERFVELVNKHTEGIAADKLREKEEKFFTKRIGEIYGKQE